MFLTTSLNAAVWNGGSYFLTAAKGVFSNLSPVKQTSPAELFLIPFFSLSLFSNNGAQVTIIHIINVPKAHLQSGVGSAFSRRLVYVSF